MNTFSDKPKRKAKPKRSRRSRIIILLLLILLVGLVGTYLLLQQPKQVNIDMDAILNPPDSDPFTPFCEFETDIQIYVADNTFQYIVRPSDNRIIPLPNMFSISQHIAGSPYAWGMGIENQFMVNLETGEKVIIEEFVDYTFIHNSRTNRYLLKLNQNDNNIQDLVIYDGETQTELIRKQTTNNITYWSESDKYLLLFNPTARSHAQLFDMETFTFSDANLPSNAKRVRGWIDDERILYETPAGRLYTFSILNGDTVEFVDIRFEDSYTAGDIRYSPNITSHLHQYNWLGAMDNESTFHLFDVSNPDFHERIPMNMDIGFWFNMTENVIRIDYQNTNLTGTTLYYPNESMRSVDVTFVGENSSVKFSPDGKHGLYFPNDTQSDYIIQNFANDVTMTIDTDSVSGSVQWEEIDGISYLKYAIPHENGTSVHYLLRPDTQDRCKLGTFYTPYIVTLA